MSRVREIQVFDSNGDPIILNLGRLPVYNDEKAVQLYDSAGNPVTLTAGRLPVFFDEKEVNGRLVDPGDAARFIEFDSLFRALYSVDSVHHEVHEGDAFELQTYDEAAALNDALQIYLQTPAVTSPQKRVHLISDHEATGEHLFRIYEAITYTAGGTAKSPLNKNRGSANSSALVNPKVGSNKAADLITYTTVGATIIYESWGGQGKTQSGGNRGTTEWILKPGTQYIFELISKAAGVVLELSLEWYEHTDE
jgi:hypothetical protein